MEPKERLTFIPFAVCKKGLMLSTLAVAFVLFGAGIAFHTLRQNRPIAMLTEGFPSIGKASAPIEVVLIEDFQCKTCRVFSQKIVPKLQAQYVKAGKVRFTLVPVSFLAGSQMIANAALEIHRQNPNQFFSYLKHVLAHEGDLSSADLIRIARRIQGVDLARLQDCMKVGCHNDTLDKNLDWARNIMGDQFRTPALYVNGFAASTYSFEAIQYQLDRMLAEP